MSEERPVQDEPLVLEGEDDVPRQPSPPLDPYTPEPGPRPGERRPFRLLALVALAALVVLVVLLWAAVR